MIRNWDGNFNDIRRAAIEQGLEGVKELVMHLAKERMTNRPSSGTWYVSWNRVNNKTR